MGVSLLKKGVAKKLITYLFSLRAAPGLEVDFEMLTKNLTIFLTDQFQNDDFEIIKHISAIIPRNSYKIR